MKVRLTFTREIEDEPAEIAMMREQIGESFDASNVTLAAIDEIPAPADLSMYEPGTVLRCPECGAGDVESNDVIPGNALGSWVVGDDHAPEFVPAGETRVAWDGQETVEGAEAWCRDCDWNGSMHALRPKASLVM